MSHMENVTAGQASIIEVTIVQVMALNPYSQQGDTATFLIDTRHGAIEEQRQYDVVNWWVE